MLDQIRFFKHPVDGHPRALIPLPLHSGRSHTQYTAVLSLSLTTHRALRDQVRRVYNRSCLDACWGDPRH
jgi:hypothetical protein